MVSVCGLHYRWELPGLQSEVHPWVDAPPRAFFQLGLQTAVKAGLPSAVQVWTDMLAQFGDVHIVTSRYCFYFFSLNDYILKVSQIIYKKLKLLICV